MDNKLYVLKLDGEVCGVFSSRELAEAFVQELPNPDTLLVDITGYNLDVGYA